MKLIASFFSLTLAVFQLSGCQRGVPFDPASADSFFPLSTGSTWTYRVIDEKLKTSEVFTDRAVGRQQGNSAMDGDRVVAESSGGESGRNLTILYKFEDKYVTHLIPFGGGSQTLSEEQEFLPRLLKPGLKWSNSVFPFGSLPEGFQLTQTHRTSLETGIVQVPAGNFTNCIRIETETVYKANSFAKAVSARRLKYVDWYAPNIGLIRTQVLETGFFGSEVARVELLSFGDSPVKTVSR
jgi:hypothetical protein